MNPAFESIEIEPEDADDLMIVGKQLGQCAAPALRILAAVNLAMPGGIVKTRSNSYISSKAMPVVIDLIGKSSEPTITRQPHPASERAFLTMLRLVASVLRVKRKGLRTSTYEP